MAAVATPAREQESNALGIAALVMGIIAVVACLVPLVGIFGTPLALIALGLAIPALIKCYRHDAAHFGASLTGLILSLVALAAVFFWLVIVGASGTESAEADTVDVSAAQVSTVSTGLKSGLKSAAGSERIAKLGTPLRIDGFLGASSAVVTIDKFNAAAKSSSEFRTPGDGNTFVSARVTIQNVGDEKYNNVSWVGTSVYTKSGQGYSSDMFGPQDGRELPSSIDLKPGGKVSGWVLFEVPADEKLDSVVFDDAEWKL